MGKANLGAASGLGSQDVDFVPATEIESLRARVAVLEGALIRDLNVTDDELLRIRNSCEGQDGHVTIWATMLQKIVDSVREARRALTPVAETPNQEPAS